MALVCFNGNIYCVILLHKKHQLNAATAFEVVLTIEIPRNFIAGFQNKLFTFLWPTQITPIL